MDRPSRFSSFGRMGHVAALGARQARRAFREASLDKGVVTLRAQSREVSLPAADILLEIRRSRGDLQRMSALRIRSSTHGILRLSPRLDGLFEFLLELRAANPDVLIGNL